MFSTSKHHGRYIAEYDLKTKRWKKLIDNGTDSRNPHFSADGRKIYFSSDKTGIFNIYSYDAESGSIDLLTNVLTGAFMPSFHRQKGLLFSIFSIEGYKISRTDENRDIPGRFCSVRDFFCPVLPS